jgi:CubicO group peptidase (beta-lactamase class C family)
MTGFRAAFEWALRRGIERRLSAHAVGWTAGVVRDGVVLAAIAGGHQRAPWDPDPIAAHPTSAFHIASVSKPITTVTFAALATRSDEVAKRIAVADPRAPFLVDAVIASDLRVSRTFVALVRRLGRGFGFDDPVVAFLPPVPRTAVPRLAFTPGPNVAAVTVRHLFEHSAGLTYDGDPRPDPTPLDGIRAVLRRPTRWTPGGQTRYENENYLLVRLLLEAMTGEGFLTLSHRVHLGQMGAGRLHTAEFALGTRPALSYDFDQRIDDGLDPGPQSGRSQGDLTWVAGAAGWYAAGVDAASALDPAAAERILSPPLWRTVFADGVGTGVRRTARGLRLRGHSGAFAWGGGRSTAQVWWDATTGVSAVLTTNYGPEDPAGVLADTLDDLVPEVALLPAAPADGCRVLRVASPVGGEHLRVRVDGTAPTPGDPPVLGLIGVDRHASFRSAVATDGAIVLGPFDGGALAVTAPTHGAAAAPNPAVAGWHWDLKRVDVLAVDAADWSTVDVRGDVPTLSVPANAPQPPWLVRFVGWIHVDADGVYVLTMRTDGGVVAFIDGVRVVDAPDRRRAVRTNYGAIALRAGWHPAVVVYAPDVDGPRLEAVWNRSGDRPVVLDGARVAQRTIP